jgi:hypothetical protein
MMALLLRLLLAKQRTYLKLFRFLLDFLKYQKGFPQACKQRLN